MARARHGEPDRPGDRLVRAGALLFLAGFVAVLAIFVPFTVDLVRHGARAAQRRHERGVWLNLATFLTAAGLGIGLAGLVRQARRRPE